MDKPVKYKGAARRWTSDMQHVPACKLPPEYVGTFMGSPMVVVEIQAERRRFVPFKGWRWEVVW